MRVARLQREERWREVLAAAACRGERTLTPASEKDLICTIGVARQADAQAHGAGEQRREESDPHAGRRRDRDRDTQAGDRGDRGGPGSVVEDRATLDPDV